jgi:hypothetical protein
MTDWRDEISDTHRWDRPILHARPLAAPDGTCAPIRRFALLRSRLCDYQEMTTALAMAARRQQSRAYRAAMLAAGAPAQLRLH